MSDCGKLVKDSKRQLTRPKQQGEESLCYGEINRFSLRTSDDAGITAASTNVNTTGQGPEFSEFSRFFESDECVEKKRSSRERVAESAFSHFS
jgi:hypothetical protein